MLHSLYERDQRLDVLCEKNKKGTVHLKQSRLFCSSGLSYRRFGLGHVSHAALFLLSPRLLVSDHGQLVPLDTTLLPFERATFLAERLQPSVHDAIRVSLQTKLAVE